MDPQNCVILLEHLLHVIEQMRVVGGDVSGPQRYLRTDRAYILRALADLDRALVLLNQEIATREKK